MTQLGFRKPSAGTVEGGMPAPEFFRIGANATAAKMLPGIAVIKDTDDYSVKESAGTNSIGFLGYEYTPAMFRPTSMSTAYAVGDTVAVHRGPGRRQRALLTTSQTIVNGQPLKVTTDGYLTAATVGTDDVVADADESVTTTSSAAAIWVITRK